MLKFAALLIAVLTQHLFRSKVSAECLTEEYGKPDLCYYTPAPQGRAPLCARPGLTYCEHPVHYPRTLIHRLLENSIFNYSDLLVNESPDEFNTYFIPSKVPTTFSYESYGQNHQKPNRPTPFDTTTFLVPPKPNGTNVFSGYPDSKLHIYGHNLETDNYVNADSYYVRTRRETQRNLKMSRVRRQAAINSGQPLCDSRTQFIMPRAALNHKGNWMYVVNMPELNSKYMQLVKSEVCITQSCNALCQLPLGYVSRCEQKYLQRRLVALEESGRRLYTDIFWFPTCCVCTIVNT